MLKKGNIQAGLREFVGNYSYFRIADYEPHPAKYDIPQWFLLPFKKEDFNGITLFETTAEKAKERFRSYGITLDKLEKKIAEIIEVKPGILKKYRLTGKDLIAYKDMGGEPYTVGSLLEMFSEEEHPELYQVYEILQQLEECDENKRVTLDIDDILHMWDEKHWKKIISDLFTDAKNDYKKSLIKIDLLEDFKEYDFFICHDSRDKKTFVEPLAKGLRKKEMNPWYDKFVLKAGDSLIGKIDEGLKSSKFGIVVLSKNFITNTKWPKDEFISLKTRELHTGKKLIVPIWRKNIKKSDVIKYNLELADRFALKENDGLRAIIRDLEVKLKS